MSGDPVYRPGSSVGSLPARAEMQGQPPASLDFNLPAPGRATQDYDVILKSLALGVITAFGCFAVVAARLRIRGVGYHSTGQMIAVVGR
jgi:hypothetical protein